MKKRKKKAVKQIPVPPAMTSNFDIYGSYTGVCMFDEDGLPVQDVDDL